MAPQQITTVELPEVTEPVQDDRGWQFPDSWTDEECADWLATHAAPQTVPIPDPDVPSDEAQQEVDAALRERDALIQKLKTDGMVAAAFAVPPSLIDITTADNYDPRDFLLVHVDVWANMVEATHEETRLTQEVRELSKRLRATLRGMRKVNRHWGEDKRELKRLREFNKQQLKSNSELFRTLEDRHLEELKRQHVFAQRIARRLRKARGGRDKRERQLLQERQAYQGLALVVAQQDDYIRQLENQLSGNFPGTQL